jgi:prenylcysteine oxidase/farnesylcysteine lyase
VPNTILTSSSDTDPGFQSITWHGETYPGSGEYTVKIFSMAALDDEFVNRLIGEEPSWLYRKEWDSYPKLGPISAFAPVQPMKGFHYLGAMEPWVSTLVTFQYLVVDMS